MYRHIMIASKYILILVYITLPLYAQENKDSNEGNWLVKHSMINVGADGVTRELTFSEKVYRRADTVWVERVMSPAAEAAHKLSHSTAQGNASAHKHLPVATSAKWITKLSSGNNAQLRLVDDDARVVVSVAPPEFSLVGFEGSWLKAYHLLDPSTLKTMKPTGAAAADGTQTYESKSGGTNPVSLRVLWDSKAQVPRKVESSDALGLNRNVTTLEPIAAPRQVPWLAARSYSAKEYSDYLD